MLKNLLVLPDGQRISSGVDTHLAIRDLTLTESVNAGKELTIGSACAAMLEVSLFTPGGCLELSAGEQVTLYKVDEAGNEIKKGVFLLEKPTRPSANILKLTGYDRMVKLDRDLTGWLGSLTGWPYTLLEFARMVCNACGLELVTTQILNGDFPVPKITYAEVTGRQLMGWIGQIACSFCRSDADGRIELAWYQDTGLTVRPTGTLRYCAKGLDYETYQVAPVDRVQIKLAEGNAVWPEAEEGDNCYVITGNPILLTDVSDDLLPYLQVIETRLKGFAYTPCRILMPAGSQIPVGSTVQTQDGNGKTFTACVMTKTGKGQKDVLECTGSPRRDSTTAANNKNKIQQLQLTVRSLDGDRIVSLINLSENGVRIKGDKIRLEGVVTANSYFKVLEDGSIQAKAGKIAGWNMDSNSLYSGNSFSKADCFLCTGSSDLNEMSIGGSPVQSGWVLKAGDSFGVTKEGTLYADDVLLTGKINATSGRIGFWDIENGFLLGTNVLDNAEVEQIMIKPGGVYGFYTDADGRKRGTTVSWNKILTAAMRWDEKQGEGG